MGTLGNNLFSYHESLRDPLHSKYARLSDYLINRFSDDPYKVVEKAKDLLSYTIILNGFLADYNKGYNLNDRAVAMDYKYEAYFGAINECKRRCGIEPNNKLFSKTLVFLRNSYNEYDNLVSETNAQERQRQARFLAEQCDKCRIVGKETTFPEGYVKGWSVLFIGSPAQSKKEGKIVLQTRDVVKWKYVYGDYPHIEASGEYRGEYKSVDEMMKSIIEQCKNRYCK